MKYECYECGNEWEEEETNICNRCGSENIENLTSLKNNRIEIEKFAEYIFSKKNKLEEEIYNYIDKEKMDIYAAIMYTLEKFLSNKIEIAIFRTSTTKHRKIKLGRYVVIKVEKDLKKKDEKDAKKLVEFIKKIKI